MADEVYLDPTRRHDFILLFDVQDGNPNGDPDAGNLPRVDPETMQGIVTDVALKRKVRDYVDLTHGQDERNKIYVQSGIALNTQHERAYKAKGLKSSGVKQAAGDIEVAREWMCDNFYDVRMFGAVMTTGVNAGQVRGPMQLTFARSIDRVASGDISITRIAVTRAEDMQVKVADDGKTTGKQSEMGRKSFVPYGLYRAHGFFNPFLAAQTGVTEDDLAAFWEALQSMWDYDRSAARGLMACRGLYIFSHDRKTGNAPAHRLFDSVTVALRPGVAVPRRFDDYEVRLPAENQWEGITATIL